MNKDIRLEEIPRKKDGDILLAKGFKRMGKPLNYCKQVGNKRIHVKWKFDGQWCAGYYAHVEKYPH